MNDFDAVMAKETDAELVKIINVLRNDYQPAAVEAAEREFARRNLSAEQIKAAWVELQEMEEVRVQKETEPLSGNWKAALFLFPGLSNIFALAFFADGYHTKGKDFFKWAFYGMCFYAGLILLISLLVG